MFETCGRHQKLKIKNISLQKVHFVGLYCTIILQCTVQKNVELPTCIGVFLVILRTDFYPFVPSSLPLVYSLFLSRPLYLFVHLSYIFPYPVNDRRDFAIFPAPCQRHVYFSPRVPVSDNYDYFY